MELFINWRDEFLLGIDDVDNQHLVLARALNQLVQACHDYSEAEGGDKERQRQLLSDSMDTLYNSTREHFRFEEALMKKDMYPGYADHAREHAMLLAELKSTFAGRLESDGCYMDPDILKALKSWFIGHVSHSDRAFADYLATRRVIEEEG